jgi:hypothetical protein
VQISIRGIQVGMCGSRLRASVRGGVRWGAGWKLGRLIVRVFLFVSFFYLASNDSLTSFQRSRRSPSPYPRTRHPQVEVTGDGSGKPDPLVAFPGAYSANDPGLRWSYYPIATSYTAPGPKVWDGN